MKSSIASFRVVGGSDASLVGVRGLSNLTWRGMK